LEKIGFVSGKGKEKMRKKFWGSKKEVVIITNSNHAYLVKKLGRWLQEELIEETTPI